MTKKDLQTIALGTAVGGGLAFVIYILLKQKTVIRELNPAQVQWEGR